MQYLPFCGWLISLHIKSSSFIYLSHMEESLHFLRLSSIPLYIYTFFPLSIHLGWTFGCSRILAVANSAAVNTGALIPLQDSDFSSFTEPQVSLPNHTVVLFSIFSGHWHKFFPSGTLLSLQLFILWISI